MLKNGCSEENKNECEGKRFRQGEEWNSNEGRWAVLSITLLTLLLTPCCVNVLPCLVSSSPLPNITISCAVSKFLSGFNSSCFRSSTAGERQPGGVRDIEGNVRVKEHFLPVCCIKPSVSLLSSAVCPPHPLSSYQSVYSAWHCFLSPQLQRKNSECDSLHSLEDSGSNPENEKTSWGLEGLGAFEGFRGTPASYTPASGRVWGLPCQLEVVVRWRRNGKRGPLCGPCPCWLRCTPHRRTPLRGGSAAQTSPPLPPPASGARQSESRARWDAACGGDELDVPLDAV